MRILLIEDDCLDVEHVRRSLAPAGHVIICAGSLAEARKFLAASTPDLALVDISLRTPCGIENGCAIADDLRQRSVPFLIATGHTDPIILQAAIDAGAASILIKPIKGVELRMAVEAARRRGRDLLRQTAKYQAALDMIVNECVPEQADTDTLRDQLAQYERRILWSTLRKFGGNHIETAEALGISRRTLLRKLKESEPHLPKTEYFMRNDDDEIRKGR